MSLTQQIALCVLTAMLAGICFYQYGKYVEYKNIRKEKDRLFSLKWNAGAPPSIGWWPLAFGGYEMGVSYWNGSVWSCCPTIGDSLEDVKKFASREFPCENKAYLTWSKKWWKE
jgi:hypothetical protein